MEERERLEAEQTDKLVRITILVCTMYTLKCVTYCMYVRIKVVHTYVNMLCCIFPLDRAT